MRRLDFSKILLKNEFTIAILAAVLFIPFLGQVHLFDWDEINFAESAREMIETGDYFSVQINYERFWEKPPLFFWMQAICMEMFGVGEFAARFPNAVCGIVTLIVLFRIGSKIFNPAFARIWVMVYLGTFLAFFYFKSGIIDPWFNLFILLAIYRFYLLTVPEGKKRILNTFLAGLFLGLAVLTKGPVAILICMLCYLVIVVLNKFRFIINWKELLLLMVTVVLVCFAWFGVDLVQNGPGFIMEFINYQIRLLTTSEAGHGQPFFYHWVVLLVGCFPASVLMMKGMFQSNACETENQTQFRQWMIVMFWVVLLLFSMVTTKIVHYSSLCYFPLTFLASVAVYGFMLGRERKIAIWMKVLFGTLGTMLAVVFVAVPFVLMNKDKWVGKLKDEFARGNLEADVTWYWSDGIGGFIFLIGVIVFLVSRNARMKMRLLFASVTICSLTTILILTPKVEAISQRANIEFFEAHQNEDCYVETVDYKSYAQYFYSRKKPFVNDATRTNDWLIYGDIDKPVYFSMKIQNKIKLDTLPDVEKLYVKNGFAFFKRMPKN